MSNSQWLAHNTLIDPSTGEPLLPIGYINGKPVWPVMGGSEDAGEGAEQDGTDAGDGDGNEDDGKKAEGGNEADKDDEGGKGDTVSREEFERLMNRMKAADRRASAAETKVAEFEKANQTEAERLQSEREAAVKAAEQAKTELQTLRMKNAFLTVKDAPQWADTEDALDLLVRKYADDIEVDENGRVTGMETAVKRLVKDKPYLVKQDATAGRSGDAMNGKRKGDDGKREADEASLKNRFPALRK